MKYNVGDRVRIVSERVGGMSLMGSMDCYLNTIMTIARIDGTYYRMFEDRGDWMWSDNMIAGYEEAEYDGNDIEEAEIMSIISI